MAECPFLTPSGHEPSEFAVMHNRSGGVVRCDPRSEGHMRRREFITMLGNAAAAWPLSARAQQSTRVSTIGFLDATSRSTQGRIASEFVQRLRELGWREGQNLVVEVRWAEGQPERYA